MEKISGLVTFNQHLENKYGLKGSAPREAFEAKARAWYYAELLKDARKQAGMTQQELADRIGKKRAYISLIERGQTDMQLSTFLRISDALGLQFALIPA
jgi:ribosome-binding protein aMBF1 (putative translation factor)